MTLKCKDQNGIFTKKKNNNKKGSKSYTICLFDYFIIFVTTFAKVINFEYINLTLFLYHSYPSCHNCGKNNSTNKIHIIYYSFCNNLLK